MKRKMSRPRKQVIAAVAVIFNEKTEVLLTRRHQPDSPNHDKWQFPGGGVEFGENPLDTLHREVKEEVGLKVKLISEQPIIFSDVRQNHHLIILVFVALYTGGTVDISEDPESSDFGWFRKNAIDYKNSLPGTKELMIKASNIFQNHKSAKKKI